MGKVIYLTGAPASGKSTLCERLASVVPSLVTYSYSALLRDHVSERMQENLDEAGIRQQSAKLVTRMDVEAVDNWLLEEVREMRKSRHLVIDSHAVTKEDYGFRVTSFKLDQLQALDPDAIICLYVPPHVTRSRIDADAAGRPLPSEFEIEFHAHLQASLATQYAFALGKTCYHLDSSVGIDELVRRFCDVIKID